MPTTLTEPAVQDPRLAAEIAARLKVGQTQITITAWSQSLKELGYRFDRRMDCYCNPLYMTGERAGETYPSLGLYPVEADTGIGWANIAARRDQKWEQLKAMRESFFAVSRGSLVEW